MLNRGFLYVEHEQCLSMNGNHGWSGYRLKYVDVFRISESILSSELLCVILGIEYTEGNDPNTEQVSTFLWKGAGITDLAA